jgi:hypothetical protein
MDATDPPLASVKPPGYEGDSQRRATFALLGLSQLDLCESLASLAQQWTNVNIRHEVELAALVTDVWRRLDTVLGEYLCDVRWAMLELRDVEPSSHAPTLARSLPLDAHPVVHAARAAARAAARLHPSERWDSGDPCVRRRLDALRASLEQVTLGHVVPDVRIGVDREPPPVSWDPPPAARGTEVSPVDRGPKLRLVP